MAARSLSHHLDARLRWIAELHVSLLRVPVPSRRAPGERKAPLVVALTALVALIAGLVTPLAPAAAEPRALSLDHGHIDAFNLLLVDGVPTLTLKEDVTGSHVTHAPEDVDLIVKEQALTDFPAVASIPQDLHGRSAYYLPLSQNQELIWPGWDSQSLSGSGYDTVDIDITEVDGPGEVFLWSTSSFGQLTSLLTDGGYQLPNTIHQSYLAHVHANWAFTEPGEYHFTAHAVVTNSTTGETFTTNTGDYQFTVGDFDLAPTTVTIDGVTNPYEHGAPVELTAVPDIEVENATYTWETAEPGGEWTVVAGQDGPAFTGVAEVDGLQVRAAVTVGETTVTSEPVTLEVLEPEPVLPSTVTIDGLDNPYESGATLALEAKPDVLVEGATYRWETSTDGSDWDVVDDATGSVYTGTAQTDGQHVRVTVVVDGEDVVTSDPVTVEVTEPEPLLPTAVTIDGLDNPYQSRDTVTLEAKPDAAVEGAVYRWETSADGAGWAVTDDVTGAVYTGTAEVDGQQIRVTVVVDGQDVVTSDPVTLEVTEPEPVLPTAVTITGVDNPYAEGDSVALVAEPDLVVEGASYRWETSIDGADWAEVTDVTGPEYARAAVDGQQVRVTVVIDGEDVVTSDPVTLQVEADEPGPVLPTSVAIEGLADSYEQGDGVTLTAVPDVPVEDGTYQWQRQGEAPGGGTAWLPITGVRTATYTGTATTNGERLRVLLTVDGQDLASSAVTIVVRTPNEPGQCWDLALDHGHIDAFNLLPVDGVPTLTLKEDVTGSHVTHDPSEVELVVKEEALTDLPSVSSVPEDLRGESVYYLPLAQDQNLIWPGWDSQQLAGTGYDTVDIDITSVDGPGEIFLWSTGSFGELDSLLADGGYQLPNTIHQDYLAHVHANWAFTEPGAYYLTVTATVTNSSTGQEYTTNTGEYLFAVGDDLPPGYKDCVQPPSQAPVPPSEDDLTDENRGPVTVDPSEVRAGEQVTVDAGDDAARDYVAGFIFSDPTPVTDSWVRTDESGAFVATIPADAEVGEHKLAVVDSQNELVGWASIEVLPARDTTPIDDDDQTPDPDDNGNGGNGNGNGTGSGNGTGTGNGNGSAVCVPATSSTTGTSSSGSTSSGSSSSTASRSVVYGNEGHFDFGPVVVDGVFTIQVKDDRTAPPVWRDPDAVVFVLGDAALRSAADIPDDLSFIAPAGQDIYMIQQIQEAGVPWLGWNTQHETIVNGPGAHGAQLRLDNVEGPGEVALFLNGNFGQLVGERVVDTVGGPTTYTIPANTHQHGNWVFTEPGDYALTFTISADGQSDTATLRFSVGQADPSTAAVGAAAGSTDSDSTGDAGESATGSAQGRTASGADCTLASTGAEPIDAGVALALLAVLTGALLIVLSQRRRRSIDV